MAYSIDLHEGATGKAICSISVSHINRISLFFVLLLAFSVAGCSPKSGNDSDNHVAANVNGVEITQREVDALYNRVAAPGVSKEVAHDQRRGVLSGLVRSELLAQQAVNKKLDRSPEFILAMHEARRQVLAGLAEKSITETVKPLSPENIRKIVSDNPQFFAGRKLLVYEEVMIPGVDLPLLQSLNLSANNGASLDQLIDQLKAKKVQFRRIKLTQTSDRLEPAIFKVLSGSKQGVPLVARVEDKFAIILLLQSMQSMPLEGAAAEQAAGAMVFSRQKNMVLAKKLTELTDAAKIAYFGEFASEVSVKQGVKQKIALPAADPERITATWHRQLKMVALLIISYASVMMLFSASMRLLKGTAWLPRILSASESNAVSASSLDLPYQPGLIAWSFIIGVACLSVFALGYQLFLIWSDLLLWQMIAAVLTGLLSGIAGSYLFVHSPLRLWTRNVRGLPVLFFALLLLISVMVTNLWFTVLF